MHWNACRCPLKAVSTRVEIVTSVGGGLVNDPVCWPKPAPATQPDGSARARVVAALQLGTMDRSVDKLHSAGLASRPPCHDSHRREYRPRNFGLKSTSEDSRRAGFRGRDHVDIRHQWNRLLRIPGFFQATRRGMDLGPAGPVAIVDLSATGHAMAPRNRSHSRRRQAFAAGSTAPGALRQYAQQPALAPCSVNRASSTTFGRARQKSLASTSSCQRAKPSAIHAP